MASKLFIYHRYKVQRNTLIKRMLVSKLHVVKRNPEERSECGRSVQLQSNRSFIIYTLPHKIASYLTLGFYSLLLEQYLTDVISLIQYKHTKNSCTNLHWLTLTVQQKIVWPRQTSPLQTERVIFQYCYINKLESELASPSLLAIGQLDVNLVRSLKMAVGSTPPSQCLTFATMLTLLSFSFQSSAITNGLGSTSGNLAINNKELVSESASSTFSKSVLLHAML